MELKTAIENGDKKGVATYLEHTTSFDVKEPIDHMNPIHRAALCGKAELIPILVFYLGEPCLDEQDITGKTPLHYAAQQGDLNTVQKLIAHNATPKIHDNCGRGPKHVACLPSENHTPTELISRQEVQQRIAILITLEKARAFQYDHHKNTCLHYAVTNLCTKNLALDIIKKNVSSLFHNNAYNVSPLDIIEKKQIDSLLHIIFLYLCDNENMHALDRCMPHIKRRKLIHKPIDNQSGDTLLQRAIKKKLPKIVAYLIPPI